MPYSPIAGYSTILRNLKWNFFDKCTMDDLKTETMRVLGCIRDKTINLNIRRMVQLKYISISGETVSLSGRPGLPVMERERIIMIERTKVGGAEDEEHEGARDRESEGGHQGIGLHV